MRQVRKRLTYANVMSSIAVFLVLGGGAAFAANELAKNSVGPKQLKKNAVTTAKIKKNAVTTAKIKANAINTAKLKANAVTEGKLADGAVTGAKINAGSTSFSQITDRLRGTVNLPVSGAPQVYPLNSSTYTQPAGRTDQYVGGLEITFSEGCKAPRYVQAFLLRNAKDPLAPSPFEMAGFGMAYDESSGAATKMLSFASYGSPPYVGLSSLGANSSQQQSFAIYVVGGSCNSGSGITATGGGVDVIGSK